MQNSFKFSKKITILSWIFRFYFYFHVLLIIYIFLVMILAILLFRVWALNIWFFWFWVCIWVILFLIKVKFKLSIIILYIVFKIVFLLQILILLFEHWRKIYLRLIIFYIYLTYIINLGLIQRIFISQNYIIALKIVQLVHCLLFYRFYEVPLMKCLLTIYNHSSDICRLK